MQVYQSLYGRRRVTREFWKVKDKAKKDIHVLKEKKLYLKTESKAQ